MKQNDTGQAGQKALGRDESWSPSPEEKKRILRERAKALALGAEKKEAAGERIEILEFVLAYERYGMETRYVREVYPLRELTPLPCTPPFVLGIINVRGQILSVIDIKRFFDLPEKGLTDLNKVIILQNETMEFGVLADVIQGVVSVALGDLQPAIPTLSGVREEYLRGITRERRVILDGERLLSDKNIIVREEVESSLREPSEGGERP